MIPVAGYGTCSGKVQEQGLDRLRVQQQLLTARLAYLAAPACATTLQLSETPKASLRKSPFHCFAFLCADERQMENRRGSEERRTGRCTR